MNFLKEKFVYTLLTVFIVFVSLPFPARAYVFTNQLEYGDRGAEVAALQKVLKELGFFTFPEVTQFFGPATRAAVQAFQSAKGVVSNTAPGSGYGRVGPKTLAALNALDTKDSEVTADDISFTRNLEYGSRGEDVRELQKMLNAQGFMVAEIGPGSPGNETNWFGPATKAALTKFQAANTIEPATGFFDPLTRVKIVELSTLAAPENPESLQIEKVRRDYIELSWDAVPGATSYTIKRKETGSNEYVVIGTATTTTFTDSTVSSRTKYSYVVTASNRKGESRSSPVVKASTRNLGGGGGASEPSDTTPPTVSLTVPSDSDTVSGASVTLTATASDDTEVAGVQFAVDGTDVGLEDTSSPYSITWDSTTVLDGSRSITATAIDTSSNETVSAAITVTVDNTGPVLSSISSDPDTTTATITWTTDELSDSEIVYGLTASYGSSSSSATLTTSHSIDLAGLTAGTTYHFAVTSTDAEGNETTSSDQTFTTDAPPQHTDGLISQWLFAEGSGTTVDDAQGSNNINLDTPTTPNYTWNSRGIALANGLIQTPSITNARTVAFLYKTKRASTGGFLLSGGSTSGAGVLQENVSPLTYTHHVGSGGDVHPLKFRTGYGQVAYELNRGGYVLVFTEFNQAYSTILGFGGRHSTTTSRSDEFEIVAAAVWNDQLSSSERTQAYDYFSYIAKQRGVCLKYTDCSVQYPAVILIGESNADGRSKIVNLSTEDQNQVFTKPYIWSSNATAGMSANALFDLGVNQQQTAPLTDFGPELGFAQAIEESGETAYIIKIGKGSTFLAPTDANGLNQPLGSTSWNSQTDAAGGLLWKALQVIQDAQQEARLNDIGLELRGIQFLIGLNDSADVDYTGGSATTYQGYLQDMHDTLETYTGFSSLKMHIPRTHNSHVGSDATALGYIRQGEADFVSANGLSAELMDTDNSGLNADLLHYSAAGSLEIGQAGYEFILGSD